MSRLKKRRRRRIGYVNWSKEIAKGNTNRFYNSTDWDIAREAALNRDKHLCQYYLKKWTDGTHSPNEMKLVRANTVHHIKPIKEHPELCLDLDNLVSLSFEAHEIIEGRTKSNFVMKKRLTEEKW